MTDFESLENKPKTLVTKHYAQLSRGLLWLNERAWPLGGSILLISGLYLFQYIQVEKIPLSITSSAAVAALPAMFAMLVFFIAMLGSLVVMPAFIMFQRLNDSGERLSDNFNFESRNSVSTALRRRLASHWGYGLLLLGLHVWFIGAMAPYVKSNSWWIVLEGVVGALILWGHVRLITRVLKTRTSKEFRFACVMSAFVQWFAILNVTIVAARSASEYVDDVYWFIPFMLIVLALLWLIQLAGTYFVVVTRRHEHPVAHAVLVGMAVIFVLGLIPPVSAKLAGVTLQIPSTGARNCTVMTWAPGTQVLESVKSPNDPERSVKLRVLAEADGMYIVRPWRTETKAVQFIPRTSVTGFDECSRDLDTADAHAST